MSDIFVDNTGLKIQSNKGVQVVALLTGIFVAIAIPYSVYKTRGTDVIFMFYVTIAFGLLISSFYFKTTIIEMSNNKLTITRKWFVRYSKREILLSDIVGLKIDRNTEMLPSFKIQSSSKAIHFRWIEIPDGEKLIRALSRVTGIKING